MTITPERAAQLTAEAWLTPKLLPCATAPAHVHNVPCTCDTQPAIEIAGVQVSAYVDEAGRLRVSLHLDGDPDVWGEYVPVVVTAGDDLPIWEAFPDGQESYPALFAEMAVATAEAAAEAARD